MSDTIDLKIVDRLRKLLRLASNNDNEHEAAAAMAKAQELMAEYNLSMANLDGASTGKSNAEDGGVREKTGSVGRALYQYQRDLMAAIAQDNYCFCELKTFRGAWNPQKYKYEPDRKGYQLIGRQANVVTAQIMFDYLNERMERLVPITDNKQRLSRSAISWKEGFAARVVQRIQEKRWEMERESAREAAERATAARHPSAAPVGNQLALVDVRQQEYDLNTDLVYGLEPGTTARRRLEDRVDAERRRLEREANPVAVVQPAEKALTPAELKAQELANKKADERWERWQRAREKAERRKWANKDMNAYRAGSAEGAKINLATQIDRTTKKVIV